MKIVGYDDVKVSFGPPSHHRPIEVVIVVDDAFKADLKAMSSTGELFDQIAADRNELARLRERVAGLLERNTSLVHTKRDLEAQIKGHMEARKQAWETIQKLHARDIPIREIPICSRQDAN